MNQSSTFPEKIHYVFSGRFPSEKAHALYVAEVAEAFALLGREVVVVAPRRRGRSKEPYGRYFGIQRRFDVVLLPTIDLYDILPLRFAYYVNAFCFASSCFFYFFARKRNTLVFTHDPICAMALIMCKVRVVFEVHDYPGGQRNLFSFIFSRSKKILTQNIYKKERLAEEFKLDPGHIVVEQNGVHKEQFDLSITQAEAVSQLGLPRDRFIVLYAGSLSDWKGADTLARAATLLPPDYLVVFVGGDAGDVAKFQELYGKTESIILKGQLPHESIPLWLKAAHVLVLPNTAKKEISKFHTSPMKLFEYMASGRPIVASDIPSIRSVVTDNEVFYVSPDDPTALAEKFLEIKGDYAGSLSKADAAKRMVEKYTWESRAQRIIQHLNDLFA